VKKITIKLITIKILNLLRRILVALKNHCSPAPHLLEFSPQPNKLNVYEDYYKSQKNKCFQDFEKVFSEVTFIKTEKIKEYSIKKAIENNGDNNNYYLEFGVYKGDSINFLSKFTKKIYGFDSFEGLKENWKGFKGIEKDAFNIKGNLPKVNDNVVLLKGWFQETLIPFLEKNKPKINFVNIDCDTYDSTKFILKNIKKYLLKNSIIIFDELYNYPGYDVNEYKALKEIFLDSEYKFIALSIDGEQGIIQIN
jgi:hypothetical protein